MKTFAILAITIVLAAASASPAPAAPVQVREIKATLTGEVLEEGLVRPGDVVKDGDPIVWVRTITGRAVAARAPLDGTIVEVLVRSGQVIKEKGAVVARLSPK
jgi:biotin carboxyl carrier protein